jgi:hypothetical protein
VSGALSPFAGRCCIGGLLPRPLMSDSGTRTGAQAIGLQIDIECDVEARGVFAIRASATASGSGNDLQARKCLSGGQVRRVCEILPERALTGPRPSPYKPPHRRGAAARLDDAPLKLLFDDGPKRPAVAGVKPCRWPKGVSLRVGALVLAWSLWIWA